MFRAIKESSRCSSNYLLNPHLSLMYARINREVQKEIATNLRIPFSRIRFDKVAAISNPATIETNEDVLVWRKICSENLKRV